VTVDVQAPGIVSWSSSERPPAANVPLTAFILSVFLELATGGKEQGLEEDVNNVLGEARVANSAAARRPE
jgi:hypothetical protein